MKSPFSTGKYLQFSLLTVLILIIPLFAYPNQRLKVKLRARRDPAPEGGVSLWRRQAGGGLIVSELLDAIREALNATEDNCGNCSDIKKENNKLKNEVAKIEGPMAKNLKPAYDCDKWENKTRTCWLDRNVGDTVTFVLTFAEGTNPKVQWRQEFHMIDSKKRRQYDIDPESPMWNVVVGSRGHELRLSPVTEMDMDSNVFSASVVNKKPSDKIATQTVYFRIKVMPVDQGFVYPGETLLFNMKSVNLPTSMRFKWYLEKNGEERTLPSNMKLSPSGSVLTIWELRKEQEGVLSCSVYTNLGFLATKKRFLIKEINQSNNQLLFEPTRPGLIRRTKRDLDSEDNLKWAFRLPESRIVTNTDPDSRNVRSDKFQPPNEMDDEYDDKNVNQDDDSLDSRTGRRRVQDRQVADQDADQNAGKDGPDQQELPAGVNVNNGEQDGHGADSLMNAQQQGGQRQSQVVLEIERKPEVAQSNARDDYSRMIATCNSDLQCSSDAGCIQREPDQPGFCRCNNGFQGNGIFCWEENQLQNSVAFTEDKQMSEDRVKTPPLDTESQNREQGFEQ